MAQRPSLDADSLRGSGIINLSRVSKFRGSPDGSRTSNGGQGSAQPVADHVPDGAMAQVTSSSSPAATAEPYGIEVAAEHAVAAEDENLAREFSPSLDAVLATRQAAAAVEPPEWFIR